MTTAQKTFIEMIGNAALQYYGTYQILPSLTIAQAILESAWGKSGLSRDCHNYFGMKWTSKCGCDYKEYSTAEQRKDGSYYTIKAKFRKYASVSEGIKGYYEFLQYARYKNLKGVTDYQIACDLIRQDGWATSLNYSANLKKLIVDYNLTEWDRKTLGGEIPEIHSNTEFSVGTYQVTASSLRVRTGAGTSYPQKKFTEMTASARKQCSSKASTGLAFYVCGVRFTVKSVTKISDREYWAETPSGYVALKYDGNVYAKKV